MLDDLNIFRDCKIEGENGFLFCGKYIPEEVVMMILSRVEPRHCLAVSVVCKNWYKIVRSHTFWNMLYKYKFNRCAKDLPWSVFYCFFTRRCFTNILTNCNGERDLNDWDIPRITQRGFRVESIPCGADLKPEVVPEFEGFKSCFAASDEDCIKSQGHIIEQDRLLCEIIEKFNPRILVSEWIASRDDAAACYSATVIFFGTANPMLVEKKLCHKMIRFSGKWIKLEMEIKDYAKRLSAIFFRHQGHRSRQFQGWSGIKMAGAVVKIDFESINPIKKSRLQK